MIPLTKLIIPHFLNHNIDRVEEAQLSQLRFVYYMFFFSFFIYVVFDDTRYVREIRMMYDDVPDYTEWSWSSS
jgi:hypothetical protein